MEFTDSELDMIYNNLADALEEKKAAFNRIKDSGTVFNERDFGIPQMQAILDKIS